MRSIAKIIVAGFFLIIAVQPNCFAQQVNGRKECEQPMSPAQKQQCEEDMPQLLRMMREDSEARALERLTRVQINQDLAEINALTTYLSELTRQEHKPDAKLVTALSLKIMKCAKRLKQNLALPSPDKHATRPTTLLNSLDELSVTVATLAALVSNVLDNPTLTAHVLDVTESPRALRDLEQIIELSKLIVASSEMLSKQPRP